MEGDRVGLGPVEEAELPLEKNANLIMGTNSSSIVSKRSVERLYLPKPHFYRHFVRKPQRRSPTINRGYWIRMRAVDWIVRKFLERPTEQKKIIINLGAGYDPIPFQWLTTDPLLCTNTKFIDVDHEALMKSKRDIVLNTPELRELMTIRESEVQNKSILFNSDQYSILGCDLRNLRRLRQLINSIVDLDPQCLVLCVAEVSITYMLTADADAVLAWSSKLSSDVTFCLLEQRSPDREDHPFTATMIRHFAKLGTPLRSLSQYPGNHTQAQRFRLAGYEHVESQGLWELWGDPRFLSPSQRMALDEVEPFDEWEELALFASHYCLVVAQTGEEPLIPPLPRSLERRDSEASNLSDFSTRTVSPHRAENEWFAYKYTPNPPGEGRVHHGSAYLVPDKTAVALHGGIGIKGRQNTTLLYASEHDKDVRPAVPPEDVGARCCHTLTTLQNGQNFLCGGRAAPTAPFRDCWLQTGDRWERVQDMPEPRFRHRAVAIILPDGSHGVIVFGGKISASTVAQDIIMWSPADGWTKLRSLRSDPMPRFGASFVRLGFNHGVMMGGMRQDGIICQGLWRWRLIVRNSVVMGIKFKTTNALDTSAGIYPWIGRLGASYSVIRSELLIIGGVAKYGCIPKEYEIMSFIGSFSAFMDTEKEMELRTICVSPIMEPGTPRPLLIGHGTHRTAHETTLIVGGGCTCFSFGAYWNQGAWLMHDKEQGAVAWQMIKPKPQLAENMRRHRSSTALLNGDDNPLPVNVNSISIADESDFQSLLQRSQPKLISNLDIGPCTKLWTPTYLKSKTSPTRKAVIHSSPTSTMNFQRKDSFTYTTLLLHSFLDIISNPSLQPHMYLRSISSAPTTTPSLLSNDWPELSPDFSLPTSLSYIDSNLHSSPLRISTNLSMFLHYDVMANILFHISSTPTAHAKQLILFPPSDLKHLSFPPGSTTSTLDIFPPSTTATDDASHTTPPKSSPIYPPHTHPHLVSLPPGHALFIPPLWSHTAAPSPPGIVHISINTFFYSIRPRTLYAAGRDVYGNRDLSAYAEGRRDVEKIVRRFTTTAAAAITASNATVKEVAASGGGSQGQEKNVENGEDDATVAMKARDGDSARDSSGGGGVAGGMPKEIAKAYLERLAAELQERADAL